MKNRISVFIALLFGVTIYGQVGYNVVVPLATLDIAAKQATGNSTELDGLVIPRVDRQRAQSMIATLLPISTLIYVNDIKSGGQSGMAKNIDRIGFYFYNGNEWAKMESNTTITNNVEGTATYTSEEGDQIVIKSLLPKFFYMPSIVLSTDITDPSYNSSTSEFIMDLYQLYSAQFSNPIIKSDLSSSLPVIQNSELDYFVTYSDQSVFDIVSLSSLGVLKYKLKAGFVVTEKTFMNVVLKVK